MSVDSQPSRRLAVVRQAVPIVPLLVLAAAAVAGPRAPVAPRVEASDDRELRFSLDVPSPQWQERAAADGTGAEWSVSLPGFVNGGAPGAPRIPRFGTWIVVPPGQRPRLEIVREDWEPAGGRRLVREPVSVIEDQTGGDDLAISARSWRPGQPLPEGMLADERAVLGRDDEARQGRPAVQLGEVSWWRGRRVASLTVLPVQVDGEGRAVRSLASGTWRVRFEDEPAADEDRLPDRVGRKLQARGDRHFAFLFLNGGMLERWPTEPAARGLAARRPPADLAKAAGGAKGTPLGYPEVRLPVSSTRLYRVRASELRDAGLLPQDTVLESQIRLYQRRYVPELDVPGSGAPPYVEVEVPVHMVGEGDAFDDDDLFLFWGLRIRDDREFQYTTADGETYLLEGAGDFRELNNDYNVVWLQLADPDPGEGWARMARATLPAGTGEPEATYRRVDHLEDNNHYREHTAYVSNVSTSDRLYRNNSREPQVEIGLPLWSPVTGQTAATLAVAMAAPGNTGRSLNLTLLGATGTYTLPDATVSGLAQQTSEIALPPAAFADQPLTLRIERSIPGNVSVYVNWVELAYDARYAAPTGRLLFPGGDANAINDLAVTEFPSSDVGLIEVTDPRQPVFIELQPANLIQADGSTTLSLRVDQTGGRRTFFAQQRMTSNGVADVRYLDATRVDDPVDPTEVAVDPDLLVIVHPEFRQAAQRWIDHRRARNGGEELRVHVVEPQPLYDRYTGGLKSPWALKRFCNHALDRWGTTVLMLIGDANENARSLGLPPGAVDNGRDLVPTYLWQDFLGGDYLPEMIATDKFYVDRDADPETWPTRIAAPWDMIVGRFPCNDVAQLDRMIDKTIQMETVQPDEAWRRRALFLADDAFSSGTLGADDGFALGYAYSELDFEEGERDSCARYWRENGGMVGLVADTLMLRQFMESIYPVPWNSDVIPLTEAKDHCRDTAVAPLKTQISAGALMVHFQGHGNATVMCHEQWFMDDRGLPPSDANRWDIDDLTNTGRPFVFFGMACHLSHWARQPASVNGTVRGGSIGEKLLGWTDAGAVASYGSANYERLQPNFAFSNYILRRWTQYPPFTTVGGDSVQSRWVMGELAWAAEADIIANYGFGNYMEMCANYAVLGDPLMVLDAGAPETDAILRGDQDVPVEGEVDLVALDASNLRQVDLTARDEAGIDRVEVLDSKGVNLTAQTVTDVGGDGPIDQVKEYRLSLPVRPFDHTLIAHVYDTADRLPTDDHVQLVFRVAMPVDWYVAGATDPIDPARFAFPPGEPVTITSTFTSPAYIDEQTPFAATGEGLVLENVSHAVDATNRQIDVTFTATADPEAAAPRAVVLSIAGFETRYVLEQEEQSGGGAAIERLVNYPNPMRDATSFVFRTNLAGGQGRILIYTVSGRQVADVAFAIGAGGDVVVPWDGRDREGDRVANGVYLYRVLAETAGGRAESGMQRLVVMR